MPLLTSQLHRQQEYHSHVLHTILSTNKRHSASFLAEPNRQSVPSHTHKKNAHPILIAIFQVAVVVVVIVKEVYSC